MRATLSVIDPKLLMMHPKLLMMHPKLLMVRPKLLMVHPKLLMVRPKLLRVHPKLLMMRPKLLMMHPKLLMMHPKLLMVHPKLLMVHPKLLMVHPKPGNCAAMVSSMGMLCASAAAIALNVLQAARTLPWATALAGCRTIGFARQQSACYSAERTAARCILPTATCCEAWHRCQIGLNPLAARIPRPALLGQQSSAPPTQRAAAAPAQCRGGGGALRAGRARS